MNETKIEWCDKTLNPVVGCTHGCDYCYARRQAKRFKHRCKRCYDFVPHPHLERLKQLNPNQKPKKIFIDSMWDWNDKRVDIRWLFEILQKMNECQNHIFQILSKKPERYRCYNFPENVWLGTTITSNKDIKRIHDLVENTKMWNIRFVSVEPIHSGLGFWFTKGVIDWIIVGAETGNRKGKIIPEMDWIKRIVYNARVEGIPLFLKNNLQYPKKIQEFP